MFYSAVKTYLGSGCGAVGRAVASDTRDPRFESSHRQNLNVLTAVLKSFYSAHLRFSQSFKKLYDQHLKIYLE